MKVKKHIVYILLMTIIGVALTITTVKAATLKVTADTLNLREKASTSANILASISKGETCELLKEEGDWYQVKYKNYTGYISKEYASKEKSDIDDNTTPSTGDDTKDTNSENTTGKLSQKADVKLLPLIYSSNIASLSKNATVTIISETNGWSYVQTSDVAGWIRTELITGRTTSSTNSTNNNSDKTDTDVSGKDDENVDKNDNTTSFTEKTMYVNDSYVNLRKEASTTSSIVMVVSLNTKLTVIGEKDDWYQVKTSAGNAYVSKKLLSDKEITTTSRGGIVRGSTDNIEVKTTSNDGEKETTTQTVSSSTTKGESIVSYAKQFLGVPYVYGGASKSGFDCSGFTMYVYQKFGISMKHGAQAQAKLGKAIKADKSSASSLKNALQPGDLVFFLDYETMDEIGHCGIYVGNGNFIHASSGSGYCVKINSLLPGDYYNTRYCAARRII